MFSVTKLGVDEAKAAMRTIFPETPLQLNEHLSRKYGAEIWLKREDLSPVRSYKIRGAFNFLRKAIADGRFPLSPATIADRLIALKLDWNSHEPA